VGAVLLVTIPALLTFIPTRYLYPSRNTFLWRTTWALGTVWVLLCCWLLVQEQPDRRLVLLSSFYPFYYMAASFYLEYRIRSRQAPVETPAD
jgi:hypothetical protein